MEKSCIVTGASSGIGRHVALALLEDGFAVTIAGRRPTQLQETAEMAGGNRDRAHVVLTDVRDPTAIEALFANHEERLGRLDVLFNNAGIQAPAVELEDLSLVDWQAVVDTNLTAAFLCTQAAFRIMKRQAPAGGRIINNGSIAAHTPRPNAVAYTATKHAMTGLTKSTALDGRKYNIACGQIDIGNAGSEMTEKMQYGMVQADGSFAAEPTMDVNHVARAVAYIASLPLDANVPFMTVMATQMPYIGRG